MKFLPMRAGSEFGQKFCVYSTMSYMLMKTRTLEVSLYMLTYGIFFILFKRTNPFHNMFTRH